MALSRKKQRMKQPDYMENGDGSYKTRTFVFQSHKESLTVKIIEMMDPSYGMYVWPCSPVLAQYLWFNREHIKGKRILEVGRITIWLIYDCHVWQLCAATESVWCLLSTGKRDSGVQKTRECRRLGRSPDVRETAVVEDGARVQKTPPEDHCRLSPLRVPTSEHERSARTQAPPGALRR
ncbi:hypothetical protein V5799_000519 [Amblyomma americanum]|uniref:Uncharacterized protein n=1 Tax=Amblyomma americanum TaxID=6943 RepID=A0AAQ4D2T9_AMBAM